LSQTAFTDTPVNPTATPTPAPLLTTAVVSAAGDKVIVEFDADVTVTTADTVTFEVQVNGTTELTGTMTIPAGGTQSEAITFESSALLAGTTTVTVLWSDTAGAGTATIAAGDHASLLAEDVSV
jgi:hypothetical protein